MSRHLMARFRHLAAQPVNWQDGMVLPGVAEDMAHQNRTNKYLADWSPEHISTAIVHHGERMHALQVNQELGIVDQPHLWSIHVLHGDDPEGGGWEHLDMGDHDHECDMCEAGPGEKCDPGCWDQNSRTGGGLRNTFEDEQWQDGSRGEFWGYQPDREGAQRAAETAWAKYTSENGSGLGEVNLDEIGRGGGPTTGGHSLGDEDYGDIFGERS
jgi:hypothetical protein